jgi:hypothetical protein
MNCVSKIDKIQFSTTKKFTIQESLFFIPTFNYTRVPITQRKYLFRNYTTNHTTPADRFTTGTTMQC